VAAVSVVTPTAYRRRERYLREEHARLRAEAKRLRAIIADPASKILEREDAVASLEVLRYHEAREWLRLARAHAASVPVKYSHLSPAAASRATSRHM